MGLQSPELRWFKIFNEYIDLDNIPYKCLNILDIGCGRNAKWIYLALNLYLSEKERYINRYVGIDIDLKALVPEKGILGELAHLIVADAESLSRLLKDTYHLVVMGHPPISTYRERGKWKKIFHEIYKVLNRKAFLILTSFWIPDLIPSIYLLERSGFLIIHKGRNRYPGNQFDISDDGERLIEDKYIVVARKL